MAVATAKVGGRRKVRYANFDELLADAERAATGPVRTLGNWTPGQIFRHIGEAMHASIDGFPFAPPLPIRIIGHVLKPLALRVNLPPGYKLPASAAKLLPPPVSNAEGLAALKSAVERMRSETKRVPSPLLGRLTVPQWKQFHCRHAELHMSFIVPE